MAKPKLVKANEKIAENVVGGYKINLHYFLTSYTDFKIVYHRNLKIST